MSEQPPPPLLSPDGKFYWDGQAWQPMPSGEAASQPAAAGQPPRTLRKRMGMTGAWNSCVGYGCMLIALLIVVGALGSVCSAHH